MRLDGATDGAAPASISGLDGAPFDETSPESGAVIDDAMAVDLPDSGEAPADASSTESEGADGAFLDADSDGGLFDGTSVEAAGLCGALVDRHPIEGFAHVLVCSRVTYLTKPPSSGDHYPIWAAYASYASAVPEGFWVHDLEHGAVVLSYNCPGGCAGDVAAAQSWIDGLPGDPVCNPSLGDARVRVVMTPDPNLDVSFAASTWGWTLRAHCFDAAAFAAFFQAHYGQGPEVNCAQGLDLSSGTQDGCGE
jgi:hypothetical protein